jgi:hypothetical protein
VALVWADPFDQYGTNTALLGNAGYSTVAVSPFQSPGRTGAHSLQLFGGTLMRPFATPVATAGQGIAINMQSAPSADNANNQGIRFWSAGPTFEIGITCMPDLSFGVYDRTFALKGRTPPLQTILGSFVWVEFKAVGNAGGVINTGSCEIRVNGVTKLIVNGLNLPNIFAFHGSSGSGGGNANIFIDDYIVWDTTGIKNNDFMGDRRLFISYPNANGATQDFTPTPAGSAFDRINDSPPVDTAFIAGAAAGNISEFPKDLIGIASNDIAAMVIWGRLFKSDAGVATGRLGVNSVGNVINSPELFPGTTGSWFQQIQELDPNGNIPWTQAAYDAANLRITRVQ